MPRLTKAALDALKPEIIAALAAGETQRAVADRLKLSRGTVAVYSAAAKSVILMQDYREVILRDAKAHLVKAWAAADNLAGLLGDREYVAAHQSEVFGMGSAYRVVVETLGKLLIAVGGFERTRD